MYIIVKDHVKGLIFVSKYESLSVSPIIIINQLFKFFYNDINCITNQEFL